jgi:hypothetical protein
MGTFSSYLFGTIAKPRATFIRLCDDPRAQGQAAKAILLIGALYTLTVIGFAIAEMPISMAPWLALPVEGYYFREIFYALPVMLLGWIFAAGVMQVFCRILGGSGSFEGTMATLGFALTLPTFVTWLPESVGAVLFLTGVTNPSGYLQLAARPGILQVFLNLYQIVAVAWMLALVVIAAAVSHSLRWWKAAIAGILGIVIFMGIMLVFIR